MSEKKESTMVKVGALWNNEGESKLAFSGKFGDAKMLIFPNGYKESSKHPDYIVYLAPFEKKGDKPASQNEGSSFDQSEEVPF